jgi:hypothetical protein
MPNSGGALLLSRLAVQIAQLVLKRPDVQARNDLAKQARTYLVRQLYYGDRVLALVRDGRDCAREFDLLLFNKKAAGRAVQDLKNGISWEELDRR